MASLAFISQTDPRSGKVSSASARRTIRSHVMKTYMTKKEKLGNLNAKQSAAQPSERDDISSNGSNSPKAAPDKRAPSIRSPSNDTSPTAHSLSVDGNGRKQSEGPFRQLNRATDAFIYAGSSIDVKSYGFFSHYASEFHIILCEGILPLPLAEQTLCCSAAVQENCPALLYAICFTAAAHEAAARSQGHNPLEVLPHSATLVNPYQEALRYKALSLQLLTKLLTQTSFVTTEATILCVIILLAAAAVYGDEVALTAHSNGLRHMLELLGGEHNLSHLVSAHVQLATLKSSLVQQTPPPFKLRPHIQCRFDALIGVITNLEESAFPTVLGSGFFSCAVSSEVCPVIQGCLRYMTQFIVHIERAKAMRKASNPPNVEDFIALEHVLISMPYQISLSAMDECIRLALLLYSNIAIWKTPLWFSWVVSLLSGLKIALLSLEWQNIATEHVELLFWILFMGRHAASAGQEIEELTWWSIKLKCLLSDLRLEEWGQARQILEKFFFVEDLCGKSWRLTWEAVMTQGKEDKAIRSLEMRHPCNHHL